VRVSVRGGGGHNRETLNNVWRHGTTVNNALLFAEDESAGRLVIFFTPTGPADDGLPFPCFLSFVIGTRARTYAVDARPSARDEPRSARAYCLSATAKRPRERIPSLGGYSRGPRTGPTAHRRGRERSGTCDRVT